MAIDSVNIGTRIRFYRVKMNLSQEQLAEQTNLSNVYISYLERGERIVERLSCAFVLHALGKEFRGNLPSAVAKRNYGCESLVSECSEKRRCPAVGF